jgi:hypothetical protein
MKQALTLSPSHSTVSAAVPFLQRKCACGTHTSGGECQSCKQTRLQRKPSTIAAGDSPLEREADRAAAAVMGDRSMPVEMRAPPRIARASTASLADPAAVAGHEAPAIVHDVLHSSGQPLDAQTRTFFEDRLDQDFSTVRVHTDANAAASAAAIHALAYTAGHHVVFGAGQFEPAGTAGRTLLAHELAHVVQQTGGAAPRSVPHDRALAGSPESQDASTTVPHAASRNSMSALPPPAAQAGAIQRKVILNGKEMSARNRAAFLKARKWTHPTLAAEIMEDMASAGDPFDFKDDAELEEELHKRLSTVGHMEESQRSTEVQGDKRTAFGYPFTGASQFYGPRVNYAAREYWDPTVPDTYDIRKDKAKNELLKSKPRHERCGVYGDPCGDYGWKLSKKGRSDPYHAIAYLFKPQPAHKRSLLHCDYLISLVNFMSLADAVGAAEFNKRVAKFGAQNIVLRWNAFNDLNADTFKRSSSGDFVGSAPTKGLASTQRVRPSSEADLVLGDHVVFFNHLAYDLINERIGNAWRLENAVLVSKVKGKDVFLGHGSGYKTADQMRAKLAEEFNDVAGKALTLHAGTQAKDKKTKDAASKDLAAKFPRVKDIGGEARVQGTASLCKLPLDQKLHRLKPSEVIGPRSPCDVSLMNEVERPIESAK